MVHFGTRPLRPLLPQSELSHAGMPQAAVSRLLSSVRTVSSAYLYCIGFPKHILLSSVHTQCADNNRSVLHILNRPEDLCNQNLEVIGAEIICTLHYPHETDTFRRPASANAFLELIHIRVARARLPASRTSGPASLSTIVDVTRVTRRYKPGLSKRSPSG